MQNMFANLALTNQDHYTPRPFWNAFKDYDGQRLNLREHQDAYEFFTRLQVPISPTRVLHCPAQPNLPTPCHMFLAMLDACANLPHILYALHVSFLPCAVTIDFAEDYIVVSGSHRTLLVNLTHNR